MNLKDLKKEIPFKWRVQSTNKYGCTCVAYIDARDVQDMLDDVVGANNWQCKYKEHKGNLFCSIGIRESKAIAGDNGVITIEDTTNFIWKSDCGTESQVEKQKGEASDAFKRAAVMWGVGRFLYSLKIIKIKEVILKDGKYFPALNGQRIYDINEHCNRIHNTKPVDRRPQITNDQFQKAKNGTKEQIKQMLNGCRMGADQRETLERLSK